MTNTMGHNAGHQKGDPRYIRVKPPIYTDSKKVATSLSLSLLLGNATKVAGYELLGQQEEYF